MTCWFALIIWAVIAYAVVVTIIAGVVVFSNVDYMDNGEEDESAS